jgi:hypothetical protein
MYGPRCFDGGKGIGAARPRLDQGLADLSGEPYLLVDRLATGMEFVRMPYSCFRTIGRITGQTAHTMIG